MKRKLFKTLFTFVCSLVFLFSLSACNVQDTIEDTNDDNSQQTPHIHSYCEWQIIEHATCTEEGKKTRSCICGDIQTEKIIAIGHDYIKHKAQQPTCTEIGWAEYLTCSRCDFTNFIELSSTGHAYSNEWTYNEDCHWHSASCEHIENISEYADHNWENNICKVCNYIAPFTIGLEYTEIKENGLIAGYSVTGIGTATDTTLIIPTKHYGKPVISIGEKAFYQCSTITSVSFPVSMISIEDGAFWDCANLRNINIPEGVTYIGDKAFALCVVLSDVQLPKSLTKIDYSAFSSSGLQSIIIPNNVEYIGSRAFNDCKSLKNVTIGNNVIDLPPYAFYGCDNLKNIVIPDSITNIGSSSFAYSGLTSITIGEGVKTIKDNAFRGCDNLKNATFKIKTGWYYLYMYSISTGYEKVSISSSDLSNITKAAEYLRGQGRPHGMGRN